jgi:hypothetical protein
MRVVPQQISHAWIETLSDEDMIDIEARLHAAFTVIERREKKALGHKYELCRGTAELMFAWDRWSRISAAARDRSLVPRRVSSDEPS